MSEEELNGELAEIEAALASVGPRPSRLDRDRVMYLAGRAATFAAASPPRVSSRWAWPAAFGAMTAVAAVLLLMVVSRPHAEVAHRVEETGVQQKQEGSEEDEASGRPSDVEQRHGAPRTIWHGLVDEDVEPLHPDTPYFRERDRILALGSDPWTPAVSPATGHGQAEPPMLYPQLLDTLLEDLPKEAAPPTPPFPWKSPLESGVES
jgi:hypothetical protein